MDRKRKDKSDKTSERIMAAARTVFAQKGYNGARIDEIAARANVNKATIYYQIGDKDTLYTGALHQVIGHVARDIADAVSRSSSGRKNEGLYHFHRRRRGGESRSAADDDARNRFRRRNASVTCHRGYCLGYEHPGGHSGGR